MPLKLTLKSNYFCHPTKHTWTRVVPIRKIVKKKKSSTNYLQKIFSFVSLVLSFNTCAWQLSICLEKYLDAPIGSEVLVSTFNTLHLPTIYICPFAESQLTETYRAICAAQPTCDKRKKWFRFDSIGQSIDDLWKNTSVKSIVAQLQCEFTSCDKKEIEGSFVDTILGRCKKFDVNGISWNFVGSSTLLELLTSEPRYSERIEQLAKVSLYPEPIIDKYILPHHIVNLNKTNILQINAVKEFYRVGPCVFNQEHIDCINRCLDKHLLQTPGEYNCRLPFLKGNKNECLFVRESVLTLHFQTKSSVKFDRSNCNCPNSCTTLVFSSTLVPDHQTTDNLVLKLGYSGNIKEVIKEYHRYPASTFFSEIAGNVGFYLGISLLGALQFINAKLFN